MSSRPSRSSTRQSSRSGQWPKAHSRVRLKACPQPKSMTPTKKKRVKEAGGLSPNPKQSFEQPRYTQRVLIGRKDDTDEGSLSSVCSLSESSTPRSSKRDESTESTNIRRGSPSIDPALWAQLQPPKPHEYIGSS